jgi:hypothetical protein
MRPSVAELLVVEEAFGGLPVQAEPLVEEGQGLDPLVGCSLEVLGGG